MSKEHDQPSMAVDIMKRNGVSLEDLKKAGVDDFDLKPIRKEWYATFRNSDWKRRRSTADEDGKERKC